MTDAALRAPSAGWSEFWKREDWWAIWLGLGIVAVGLILFESGGSLRWLAVLPAKWSSDPSATSGGYYAFFRRPVRGFPGHDPPQPDHRNWSPPQLGQT